VADTGGRRWRPLIGLAYAFEQASQALSWPSLQDTLPAAVGRGDSLRSWIPGVA
jgi:hypothetical protein